MERTREVAGCFPVGFRVFKGMTKESLAHSRAGSPVLDGLCSSRHLGQACTCLSVFRDGEKEREREKE